MPSLPLWPSCLLSGLAFLLFGCGSDTGDKAAPLAIPYELDFGSSEAAAATENVRVIAFAGVKACPELAQQYLSRQLPAIAAEAPFVSPCDLEKAPSFELPYGDYTMVAVATRASQDPFLFGCAVQKVGPTNATTRIQMSLATFAGPDRKLPDELKCKRLADKCGGRCVP
jgi:hypothetical protein